MRVYQFRHSRVTQSNVAAADTSHLVTLEWLAYPDSPAASRASSRVSNQSTRTTWPFEIVQTPN